MLTEIKMFIVEDDECLQNLYQKMAKQYNFEIVDSANKGNEAIEKFSIISSKIDVVLMDYNLPEKNGIELSKIFMEINPLTIIIFVSGASHIKGEVIKLGHYFWDKLSGMSKLFNRLIDIVDSKHSRICNRVLV